MKKENAERTPWWIGTYRFWFWVSVALAAYHLADFFYVGVRAASFALEWALWRSLFNAVMFAGIANYFRHCIRNATR